MASDPYIVSLEDCTPDDLSLVGGKAMALGSLLKEGFQVPSGFAVSTQAYREHIAHSGLAAAIERLVRDADTLAAQRGASKEIGRLFEGSLPSPRLEDEVLHAHEELCRASSSAQPMAVRSSATAEDLADASFAGQQETYLWIIGGQQVLQHVVRCWASLFTPQAIAYRQHLKTPLADLAMGVVVQCMVPAEVAGVMLTIDPVNGDRSAITIEASYGLGAAVVNGEVTPDRFCVDKVVFEIRSRALGDKTQAYRFDPAVQGARLEPVSLEQRRQLCLSDDEVIELATLGKRMEAAMGRPQDMEWAIGPGQSSPREVFLLQARPETVWSVKERTPVSAGVSSVMAGILRSMHVPVDDSR
jgi:pyruvate,water dikinase